MTHHKGYFFYDAFTYDRHTIEKTKKKKIINLRRLKKHHLITVTVIEIAYLSR